MIQLKQLNFRINIHRHQIVTDSGNQRTPISRVSTDRPTGIIIIISEPLVSYFFVLRGGLLWHGGWEGESVAAGPGGGRCISADGVRAYWERVEMAVKICI